MRNQKSMQQQIYAKERYERTRGNYRDILANLISVSNFGAVTDPAEGYNRFLPAIDNILDGNDIIIDILQGYLNENKKSTKDLSTGDYKKLVDLMLPKMREHLDELRPKL